MTDLNTELKKPARKASRAARLAAKTAKATADAVAQEARTFSRRSTRVMKGGAAKIARNADTVRGAGGEAADIAHQRLRSALESLQASSEEMSRWAGSRASEARGKTSQLVQERPFGAVGAILAVGALLGVVAALFIRE